MPAPTGLARRVSAIQRAEELAATLRESWPGTTAGPIDAGKLEDAVFEGLLSPVPGEAYRMSAKDARVAESMAGNRYVGIHVALSWDQERQQPEFHEVFPGGPADRGGVRKDDWLEAVDGVESRGTTLRDVVERLRGEEGTDVTVVVRGPKEAKPRTLRLTRGQLPHATIEGLARETSGEWKLRLDGPAPIGYLRIKEIAASTPHELRKLAGQMERDGLRALVLDLRAGRVRRRGACAPGRPAGRQPAGIRDHRACPHRPRRDDLPGRLRRPVPRLADRGPDRREDLGRGGMARGGAPG